MTSICIDNLPLMKHFGTLPVAALYFLLMTTIYATLPQAVAQSDVPNGQTAGALTVDSPAVPDSAIPPAIPAGIDLGLFGDALGVFDKLNLSETQRREMALIVSRLRSEHWGLIGEALALTADINEQFLQEPMNAERIGSLYQHLYDVKTRMLVTSIQAWNVATSKLSEEQAKRLNEILKNARTAPDT